MRRLQKSHVSRGHPKPLPEQGAEGRGRFAAHRGTSREFDGRGGGGLTREAGDLVLVEVKGPYRGGGMCLQWVARSRHRLGSLGLKVGRGSVTNQPFLGLHCWKAVRT